MLRKIYSFFLRKWLFKKYYKEQAEQIMEEYLKEDKSCIGTYNKKGKMQKIQKLELIRK